MRGAARRGGRSTGSEAVREEPSSEGRGGRLGLCPQLVHLDLHCCCGCGDCAGRAGGGRGAVRGGEGGEPRGHREQGDMARVAQGPTRARGLPAISCDRGTRWGKASRAAGVASSSRRASRPPVAGGTGDGRMGRWIRQGQTAWATTGAAVPPSMPAYAEPGDQGGAVLAWGFAEGASPERCVCGVVMRRRTPSARVSPRRGALAAHERADLQKRAGRVTTCFTPGGRFLSSGILPSGILTNPPRREPPLPLYSGAPSSDGHSSPATSP